MNYAIKKMVLAAIFLFSSSQLLADTSSVLPVWGKQQILTSHVNYLNKDNSSKSDIHADPLYISVLFESGEKHVTVFDGNKLEPVIRFPVRSRLRGKPIYSTSGRFVYLSSADGWVSKFDLYQLKMVAEIRAGIHSSSTAISGDDRFIIVGNYLPNTLVVLDAKDLGLVKIIPAVDRKGKSSSISAVYDAKPRRSFLASLKDSSELWEINYQTPPPAGFGKWVHDYRKDSGEADVRSFPVRRLSLNDPIDNFFLDQEYVHVIASSDTGRGQVVDLDLGRKVADLDIANTLGFFSGATWPRDKDKILAIPDSKGAFVNIINMKNWKLVKKIPTLGSSFVIHSFENSPYTWVDITSDKDNDVIHVIDKESLEIVKTLRPQTGKSMELLGFTRNGRHALVSQKKPKPVVLTYNAKTLEEVKRTTIKPIENTNVYK